MCGRARDSETGTALVELTLTLPILVALLAGAAQYGRLAYLAIEVANAARAGVAYGAQNHATASDTAAMVLAAKHDGVDVTGTDVTTALSATASNLCACSNALTSTSTCSSTFSCSGTNRIVEYVQVNTTAGITSQIYVPGLPRTFTLNGQAIMRVAQ